MTYEGLLKPIIRMPTEFSSGIKLKERGVMFIDPQLEFLGYVERRLVDEAKVEYKLTPSGEKLARAVKNLLKVIDETLPKGGVESAKNIFEDF